jgi:hypothetical protein
MNSEMENERNERKKFTPTADFTQYIIDTKFRPYVCSLYIKDGDKKAFREVKAFVNHFLFDHGITINEKFRKEKLHGFKCYHPHCISSGKNSWATRGVCRDHARIHYSN